MSSLLFSRTMRSSTGPVAAAQPSRNPGLTFFENESTQITCSGAIALSGGSSSPSSRRSP